MRKIQFTLMIVCFAFIVCAQQNEGVVNYQIIDIDTINNTINIQDSVYSRFTFKPNKTKWELGFLKRSTITKTILNELDFYVIIDEPNAKIASHGVLPNQNSYNQLLNYQDTSLIIDIFNVSKTIAGRDCKKMSIQFGLLSSKMILWYDDKVECNSIIPGVGINGNNIKGLIMEYEIPSPTGKNIVTANSINFQSIDNAQFTPDLTGYEVTELAPTQND